MLATLSLYDLFQLSMCVGWDEGVIGMQIGEVARLRVYYLFYAIITFNNLLPFRACLNWILT